MYFDNCKDLNELKQLYKSLVLEHHPDRGGDLETMKVINIEHDRRFEQLKRQQNTEAAQPDSKVRKTTETPEEFRAVVEALLTIEEIEIELCGSWLWISGDTFACKDRLKAAGCMWSRSKRKWYWRHAEDSAHWSRGKQTMDQIRHKYGSALLTKDESAVALPA